MAVTLSSELLPTQTLGLSGWLEQVQEEVERALEQLLVLEDERGLDARWSKVQEQLRRYALRPGKRLRPALLTVGWRLSGRRGGLPPGLWRFAAGLELLHTFLLIHDDVADQAVLRRGGPALHCLLGAGSRGESLAVVAGDHLFARSVEAMLCSGLPRAEAASQYYLRVCRHTAVGQFLDLELSQAPLQEVSLFQTLKVARLKTARYGFCAPLVAGAMLGGGEPELRETLERLGHHLGIAYQLQDDLLGLFGTEEAIGKPGDSDFAQGKRTYPVIAAYARASTEQKKELAHLWSMPTEQKDAQALEQAREQVERCGGRAACERAIHRSSRTAQKLLATLPNPEGIASQLSTLITRLAHRAS